MTRLPREISERLKTLEGIIARANSGRFRTRGKRQLLWLWINRCGRKCNWYRNKSINPSLPIIFRARGLTDVLQHVMRAGSRWLDVSPSVGKACKYAVHPLYGEEELLDRGFSSQVVCMGWRSMISAWVGVLRVHLSGSREYAGNEFRDRPARGGEEGLVYRLIR